MIALAVIALLAGVGGSLVAHMNYGWLEERVTAMRATSANGASTGDAAAEGANGTASNATPTDFGSFYEVDNMIVNPAKSQGSRYLMVNVGFESDVEEVLTELENKEVVVRDRVIKLLGEFTVPELSNIDQRPFLKDTLRTSVNQVLQKGSVRRLYFTQYVLQ
jgi:flagellar basal body-associated protein FliL